MPRVEAKPSRIEGGGSVAPRAPPPGLMRFDDKIGTRSLQLPAKMTALNRVTLGMRLRSVDVALSSDDLPHPYSFTMHDGAAFGAEAWSGVIKAAGQRRTMEEALALYDREFGSSDRDALAERQIFLVDDAQRPVGTVTAWFTGDVKGPCGMVHWLSVDSAVQGKGLAKPMLKAAVILLQQLHPDGDVCLITHTQAARAICMYVDMGFVPWPLSSLCDRNIGRFSDEEIGGWGDLSQMGVPHRMNAQ